MNEELILQIYGKYAPGEELTDERIALIKESYQGKEREFLNDFYSKYAPEQEVTEERVEKIFGAFGVDKKEEPFKVFGQEIKKDTGVVEPASIQAERDVLDLPDIEEVTVITNTQRGPVKLQDVVGQVDKKEEPFKVFGQEVKKDTELGEPASIQAEKDILDAPDIEEVTVITNTQRGPVKLQDVVDRVQSRTGKSAPPKTKEYTPFYTDIERIEVESKKNDELRGLLIDDKIRARDMEGSLLKQKEAIDWLRINYPESPSMKELSDKYITDFNEYRSLMDKVEKESDLLFSREKNLAREVEKFTPNDEKIAEFMQNYSSPEEYNDYLKLVQKQTDEKRNPSRGQQFNSILKQAGLGIMKSIAASEAISQRLIEKITGKDLDYYPGIISADEALEYLDRRTMYEDAKIPTALEQEFRASYVDANIDGKDLEVEVEDGKFLQARDKDGYVVDLTEEQIDKFNKSGLAEKSEKRTKLSGLKTAAIESIPSVVEFVGTSLLTRGASVPAAAARGLTGAAAKKFVKKRVQNALTTTVFATQLGDTYVQDLKRNGGDVDKAIATSLSKTAITATLTRLFPYIESGGIIQRESVKSAINSLATGKITPLKAKRVFSAVLGELGEEEADLFLSNLVDYISGMTKNPVPSTDDVLTVAAVTPLVSAPVPVLANIATSKKNVILDAAGQIANAGFDSDLYSTFNDLLASNPSEQARKEIKSSIDYAINSLESNPKITDDVIRQQLGQEYFKQKQIQNKLSQDISPDARKNYENQLEKINKRINAIQKQSTDEVPVRPEARVSQKVEEETPKAKPEEPATKVEEEEEIEEEAETEEEAEVAPEVEERIEGDEEIVQELIDDGDSKEDISEKLQEMGYRKKDADALVEKVLKRGEIKVKEDTSKEQKIDKELSKSSGTTQVATTTGSYVKVANIIKDLFSKIRKIKGEVLDYGAGLGLGTDAMSKVLGTEVDSFEVNPGRWKGKKPVTYTKPSDINKLYDVIVSLNVLNVVPKGVRDFIVKDIYKKLKPGGTAIISSRGFKGDIARAKNFEKGPEDKSYIIKRKKGGKLIDVYQKGFDGDELAEYVQGLLGDKVKVEQKNTFGNKGIIVKKIVDTESKQKPREQKKQETPEKRKKRVGKKFDEKRFKPRVFKKTIKVFKGERGKVDEQTGKKTTAHPGAKGVFATLSRDVANDYNQWAEEEQGQPVSEFTIKKGATFQVVSVNQKMGVTKIRPAETKKINESKADVVLLNTIDSGGREIQYIIKNPDIIKTKKPVEQETGKEETKKETGKEKTKKEAGTEGTKKAPTQEPTKKQEKTRQSELSDIDKKAKDGIKKVESAILPKDLVGKISRGLKRLGVTARTFLKNLAGQKTTKGLEAIRSLPLKMIDDIFGNVNKTTIYDTIIRPLAKAFSLYEVDSKKIKDMLEKVERLNARGGKVRGIRKVNDIVASKFRVMTYLLQREFESNPDAVGVAPAIEFVKKTINAIKNPDSYKKSLRETDLPILEEIQKELSKDGVSAETLFNNLKGFEKKMVSVIDKVNSSLRSKAEYASVLNNRNSDFINNYIHHDVLKTSDDETKVRKDKVEKMVNADAGILEERTEGAKAINFDPIAATAQAANEILLDYHLSKPLKIYDKIKIGLKNKAKQKGNKKEMRAVSDLFEAIDEANKVVLTANFLDRTLVEDFLGKVREAGYYATLSSVYRSVGETISNMSYATLVHTGVTANAIKNYSKFIMNYGDKGVDFMRNVGSKMTMRLYDKRATTGKFASPDSVDIVGKKVYKSKNLLGEKIRYILDNIGTARAAKGVEVINQFLLSAGDQAIARPLFYGMFTTEFEKETGIKLTEQDLIDIADGKSKYLSKEYEGAIKKATEKADDTMTRMATSRNPYDMVLKYRKQVVDNESQWLSLYRTIDGFMKNFVVNEFSTARQGIFALAKQGDITKTEATRMLAGVTVRMVAYGSLIGTLKALFLSMLGVKNEEEEEDDEFYPLKRATLSSAIQLLIGKNAGNMPLVFENLGVEYVNKRYLEEFRNDENYDQYKHSLTYGISQKDLATKSLSELLMQGISGPLSPAYKTLARADKLVKKTLDKDARPETRERAREELSERIPFEIIGNIGLIPFYKDFRTIALEMMFDDSGKYRSILNSDEINFLKKSDPKTYKEYIDYEETYKELLKRKRSED